MPLSEDNWRTVAQAASYQDRPANLADPRVPAIASMLRTVDAISPFSTATHIVDSGCGTGAILSSLLAESAPFGVPADCKLVASDYSNAMLAQVDKVKAQNSTHKLWPSVETIQDDAQTMSHFDDASVSHILSSMAIFLVPDPAAAMRAHHRILRPDGIFASISLHGEKTTWAATSTRALATTHPELAPLAGSNSHNTPQGVEAGFRDVGFKDVRVWEVDVEMGFESRKKWARFCTDVLPNVRERVQGLSEDEREGVRVAIAKEVEKLTLEQPGAMKGVAIIGLGRK